jgi:UDP-N-acetylmuramyl-tripeptide synthetase
MEVSSHAIDQKRVFATEFAVKAFTNLSQDHLDYHGDVEAYFQAKASFCLAGDQPVVINSDDEYGRRLIPAVGQPVTFGGNESADFRVGDIRATAGGSEFVLSAPDGDHKLTVRIPGIFNVMNAAAAAAAARCQDAPWTAVEEGLAGLESVPGRFERVEGAEGYAVIVDYAHTPDGLAKALESARELTSGRLINVFGCGGDRDKAKRPIMGKISASLADVTIVTSDNPRSEDPGAIIKDICRDLKPGECLKIVDRQEAIAQAIEMAGAGDLVLIAGKGHEKTQEFADRVIAFDDTAVAREEIMKVKNR